MEETVHSMQGLVQSGFLWGYMATQMIGGSLADKYGGVFHLLGTLHHAWHKPSYFLTATTFPMMSVICPLHRAIPLLLSGCTCMCHCHASFWQCINLHKVMFLLRYIPAASELLL